jgi:dethiobiotin synthetase
MSKRFFITGTDTGIGKTYVSCKLLEYFNAQGLRTIALKPIASGAHLVPNQGLRNEDALALQQHASVYLPYEQVNPICFEPAVAPHIAAAQVGYKLTLKNILASCQATLEIPADIYLIEGAGGWYTPIHGLQTFADFAAKLAAEVVLVVGMRLGCINHSLLTIKAIKSQGCQLKGWIANSYEEERMPFFEENLHTLEAYIDAPLLGTLMHQGSFLGSLDSQLKQSIIY